MLFIQYCFYSLYVADPFVRVLLIIDGKKLKRKKTSVRRSSTNPVWNEEMTFNLPADILPKVTLEINVLDHDILGYGEVLGSFSLGAGCLGDDLSHWKEMMSNHRKSTAMWHTIRK